jgi:drug/metabolite transporter (DMT)-like permease
MLQTPSSRRQVYPAVKALLAAALFGASAPLAKALLADVAPVPLAGLLYLGCGIGALLYLGYGWSTNTGTRQAREARLARGDWPWLAGAVAAGGVAAPILLMFSLAATPAATASLLLNFEGVMTALIAGVAFHEAIGRRIWAAVGFVTAGSIFLSWTTTGEWGFSLGALGVIGACALWGLDNNFTRNISAKNPLAIVAVKGLCAGSFSLLLALILGNPMPSLATALKAMLVGSLSYGLSIVLFIMALRDLGAARTSALYGTAPFLGILLAVVAFGERPGQAFLIAIPLMVAGAVLLLGEDHGHGHSHEGVEHEHSHRHDDDHHTHDHLPGELVGSSSHSHGHRHDSVTHVHPHTPDLHHRHEHKDTA